MTRACCPGCRLRFTQVAAAHLTTCPECGAPLVLGLTARDAVGFQLQDTRDSLSDLAVAMEMALPEPPNEGERWQPRTR